MPISITSLNFHSNTLRKVLGARESKKFAQIHSITHGKARIQTQANAFQNLYRGSYGLLAPCPYLSFSGLLYGFMTISGWHVRTHQHHAPVTQAATSTGHKSISGKLASSVYRQKLLYILFRVRNFIFFLLPCHCPTPQTYLS